MRVREMADEEGGQGSFIYDGYGNPTACLSFPPVPPLHVLRKERGDPTDEVGKKWRAVSRGWLIKGSDESEARFVESGGCGVFGRWALFEEGMVECFGAPRGI